MSQNLAVRTVAGKIFAAIGISVWVLLGLFGFTLAAFALIFALIPDDVGRYLTSTSPGLFTLIALQYVITLAVVVGVPFLIRRWSKAEAENLKQVMGVLAAPRFRYILAIPLVWAVYLIVSNIVVALATSVPGFNADEVQDVGFSNMSHYGEFVLAFIALVILAPLVEELLFRGYLFGKLRAIGGFWPSAILTSIIFGVAHQQWNVGIDVFVLSLFLCALREKSGSIWAGVGLHAFKNSVAYFLLFIGPLIGINVN